MSVTGRVAWQDLFLVETRWPGGGAALQDAGEWWKLITDAARAKLADGTVDASQVVAVAITGQWASTVPVDEDGVPVGDCIMWQDHRGIRLVKQRIGGPVAGYSPKALATWVRRTAGIPGGNDPIGHNLVLAQRAPRGRRRGPLVPRARRLPGHALHRCRRRVARVDDGVVAHRQPRPRHARATTTSWSPWPASTARSCRPSSPPARSSARCAPTSPPTSACPTASRSSRACPTSTPPLVGSGAVHPGEAHMALSTTSWISTPVLEKKTDVLHGMATVPGLAGEYLLANNHDTAGLCPAVAARPGRRPRRRPRAQGRPHLRRPHRPGRHLAAGRAAASSSRRGSRASARRSSDRHIRGGFHNLSLAATRADMVRAVLEGVAYNNRWLHGYVEKFAEPAPRPHPVRRRRRHVGPLVPDPRRRAGPHDRAGGRAAARPAAGRRRARRPRPSAWSSGPRCGTSCEVEATFRPDPATREVYDRHFAELPRIYKADKSIHKRLNRRRTKT